MGATITLLAFAFVAVSVIVLHMQYELANEATLGASQQCSATCDELLGLQTCIDRQVPPNGLLCQNFQSTSRLQLESFQCACPYQPLLHCVAVNSTVMWAHFVPSDASTGTCKPNKPICIWAISVLLALAIGLNGLLSCLLCGCHSKQQGGCNVPGIGLLRVFLGMGVAGPGGVAASKVMSLV